MISLAELYREIHDLEAFRGRVLGLHGDFPFEREDMIALGEAYLERYPECYSNRDCADVALGYQIVRICVIEKIIAPFPEKEKKVYRALFTSASQAQQCVRDILSFKSPEDALGDYTAIAARVNDIKIVIDTIPTGMVKERFVGGISNIFNILYLMKTFIGQAPVPGGPAT